VPAAVSIGITNAPAAIPDATLTNQPLVSAVNSNLWFLPATNRIAIQVALASRGISSGSIDGLAGGQTEAALRAFQIQQGLPETGRPDTATLVRLQPAGIRLTTRQISDADLARPRPVPTTWMGRSQAARLEFESVLEMIAEESQSHPRLIRQLNPSLDFERLRAGTSVTIPRIEVPATRRLASIRINLGQRWLRAYDDQGMLRLHFPCSIGRIAEKRPVGALQVLVTVKDPNYTFDPAIFPESPEARQIRTKLIIPAGPNNPVGVAWIGLNRPGFGIHGTPSPEQVGRTESHGCFRLANWNAELLRRCVAPGTPVLVDP
jgi:lipoprotein-anchoring transpeptidase ErfK/SrfK